MKIFKFFINTILIAIMIVAIYVIIRNFYLESRLETRDYAMSETIMASSLPNSLYGSLDRQRCFQHPIEGRELIYLGTTRGYKVIAILEIPSINLVTKVLDEYSESSLEISVAKFAGPNPNEVGNFCITGHNYINNHMFNRLNRARVGESLFLTDGHGQRLEYIIYDIFKVWPNDTSAVRQNTNGRRIVTLITCTSDSRQRIIVRAAEF